MTRRGHAADGVKRTVSFKIGCRPVGIRSRSQKPCSSMPKAPLLPITCPTQAKAMLRDAVKVLITLGGTLTPTAKSVPVKLTPSVTPVTQRIL